MKTLTVQNGDLYVDSRGRFDYCTDRHKCAQEVANVLLQDSYEDGSWGSNLGNVEKGRIVDTANAHRALISSMAHEAIDRLMVKQDQSDLGDKEKIKEYSVVVDKFPNQSLRYLFFVSVTTVAGESIPGVPYSVQLEHRRDPELLLEDE